MTCSVESCVRQDFCKSLCKAHYTRLKKYGNASHPYRCQTCQADMGTVFTARRCGRCLNSACSVDGCTVAVWSRGWCGVHYSRWRDYGDPEYVRAVDCRACGEPFSMEAGVGRGTGAAYYCPACRGNSEQEYRRFLRGRYADKIKSYRREWYEKNRDHALEYAKRYNAERPHVRQAWMDANRATVRQWVQRRRARLKENGVYVVTPRDLDGLLRRADGCCVYCFAELDSSTVTWDHIIPISRGGAHSVGNLAPACKPCNSGKRVKTSVEWRVYLRRKVAA